MRSSVVAVFAIMLLIVLGALAEAPAKLGWVPLFNGKDLSGWKADGEEKSATGSPVHTANDHSAINYTSHQKGPGL